MSIFRLGALSTLAAVAFAQQIPTVPNDGVVNAASFAKGQAVAPGSLVSIFGTNLASATANADSIPLSTSMAGVSVTFNGVKAPLLNVIAPSDSSGASQINAQMPWGVLPSGVTSGSVSLVVTLNGVSSNSTPVQVTANGPGIFAFQFGSGQAAATNATGTAFVAPAGSIAGVTTQPAHAGDVIILYATGLGAVNDTPSDGDLPRKGLATTTVMPAVLIGGVPAQVQFSGLSPQFVGLNQINVVVPPGTPTGDKVPIQLQMGNITTSDQITIAVSP